MSEPCGGAVSVHEASLSWVCVVFLSPYRHAAGPVLSGQDTPLLEHPCSKCPWRYIQEAWLTTLWHAATLASMQRKSTNSISLIRASGISPSKPWCVSWACPAGPRLVWPVRADGSVGRRAGTDGSCPKHPLSHPTSCLSQSLSLTKGTENTRIAMLQQRAGSGSPAKLSSQWALSYGTIWHPGPPGIWHSAVEKSCSAKTCL